MVLLHSASTGLFGVFPTGSQTRFAYGDHYLGYVAESAAFGCLNKDTISEVEHAEELFWRVA